MLKTYVSASIIKAHRSSRLHRRDATTANLNQIFRFFFNLFFNNLKKKSNILLLAGGRKNYVGVEGVSGNEL